MIRRDDLSKLVVNRVIEAVTAGEKDEAMNCIRKLSEDACMQQSFLCEMISSLLTFIAKRNGEETIEEAWRYVANDCWKPVAMMLKGMEYDEVIDFYPTFHRALGSEFYVEQDEEKTVITITSCGSGGKMAKEGKYENTNRHPMNGGITKKAYTWSENRVGMPYYCAHAPLFFSILPKEWGWDMIDFEYGRQFDNDGNPVNEPCKMTIYKKPKK
jgi:hypothetical protein